MSLFNFKTDHVELTKEILELKPFREIQKREDSDRIFAYIFHRADWTSPYFDRPKEEREERLKEELLDGEEPDDQIEKAIEYYEELNTTPSLKLLKSARKGIRTLQTYFEQENPIDSDNPGRAAKDLMNNLEKVGKILNSLDEWETIIKKEKDKEETRKGVRITPYNE